MDFDFIQLLNGAAATVAALIWLTAIPDAIRLKIRFLGPITTVCFGASLWYGVINLLLGFGLLELELQATVPYFRLAFSLLVIAPALRMLVVQHLRRVIVKPLHVDLTKGDP